MNLFKTKNRKGTQERVKNVKSKGHRNYRIDCVMMTEFGIYSLSLSLLMLNT